MTNSDVLIKTNVCPLCGHTDAEHHHNTCHHVDTWLGLHKREFRRCECHVTGSEGRAAAAAWNAYLGRDTPNA